MAMSPLMSILQMGAHGGTAATAGLAGADSLGGDATKFVGSAVPDLKPFGGAGGLGAGMGADLGKARLVGAMSVPPTWQGSMPARMVSSAMSGMGAMPNAGAAMAGAAQGGMGGMQPMPMPMGGMGAGGGMPGGMMGRGGASPHVLQNRPSVIPRTGVWQCAACTFSVFDPPNAPKWWLLRSLRRIADVRRSRFGESADFLAALPYYPAVLVTRVWSYCRWLSAAAAWQGWGCDGFGFCVVAAGD
jgi:hypothetical protein